MRPPTLSLFALLPLTGALSWKHTSLWKRDASHMASETGDGLAPDELALILQGSDALERYSTKQDCFRKASSLIRARCAELETREDERVKAALSMTLCEIATAENYSPPMECAPFQPGYNDRRHVPSASSHGKCVEALSRSAQYWSSYSGYLREVPQLCFAYRRWNDIDTAKELHRNSTLQSLHLLNHLAERERRFTSSHQQSRVLVQEMQALLGQLHSSSAAINMASNDIPEQLRLVINEIRHTFTDTIMSLREGMAHAYTAELLEIQSNIARVLSDLDVATSAVVPTLERSLLQAFERLISSVESRIWGLNTLAVRLDRFCMRV
ncbi:hypothetical protein BD413DRAFT_515271 [Trametes elegans]|nr:hypothetical protein BD413DRAFT_515271 [Trametes elegans]